MKEESDFKKITIIGVGLIGGSLGLALKENKPSFRIVGIDKQEIIEKMDVLVSGKKAAIYKIVK